MREIALFVEDFGHEEFLKALLQRIADKYGIKLDIKPYSVRRGYGKVITELKKYLRDLRRDKVKLLDLILVATDANCKGLNDRQREVDAVIKDFAISIPIIYAIPDPHIERWLLIDSAAFKEVFGKGCRAPDQKCEKKRYKQLLLNAIREVGIMPPLGGLEYSSDIVNAMDLKRVEQIDESLGKLLKDLKAIFLSWQE
jgi:hypothetical protein